MIHNPGRGSTRREFLTAGAGTAVAAQAATAQGPVKPPTPAMEAGSGPNTVE